MGEIRYESFRPQHFELVARLASRGYPNRPTGHEFLRWRYLDMPCQIGELAIERDQCIGMIWAFRRAYQLANRQVNVIESADWYCLPEYRNQAVGLALMQRLMEYSEPMIAVGGNDDTVLMLPKMGWNRIGEAYGFALPLRARAARIAGPKWLWTPMTAALGIYNALRLRQRGPWEMSCAPLIESMGLPAFLASDDGEAASALLPPAMVRWLVAGRGFCGEYFVTRVGASGTDRGWSLSRIVHSEGRCIAIIHQIHAETDRAEIYAEVIRASARALYARGADVVQMTTTVQPIMDALADCGFILRTKMPVHAWNRRKQVVLRRLHGGSDVADNIVLPFMDASPVVLT